ncbi:hypothetical protein HAX54_052920, partial [Datura stramonium]|nr:hypothetical protein [Datura stramonium]
MARTPTPSSDDDSLGELTSRQCTNDSFSAAHDKSLSLITTSSSFHHNSQHLAHILGILTMVAHDESWSRTRLVAPLVLTL